MHQRHEHERAPPTHDTTAMLEAHTRASHTATSTSRASKSKKLELADSRAAARGSSILPRAALARVRREDRGVTTVADQTVDCEHA